MTGQNAYTDAPTLRSNLFLGSLHLFFWLFFHPSAWYNFLQRLDLPADVTLADLTRTQWRLPAVRRLLIQACLIPPLFISLLVGLILWTKGAPLENVIAPITYVFGLSVTLVLLVGLVLNVAAGMVGGAAVGVAAGIVTSLTAGLLEDILASLAISIAVGAAGGIGVRVTAWQSVRLSPRPVSNVRMQLGGIVIGVSVGVVAVALMRAGLTTLVTLTVGLSENTAYNLARAVVVGASFGLAFSLQRGFKAGLIGGFVNSVAYYLAVSVRSDQFSYAVQGAGSGLLFGLSFGATIVLPYVLAERVAGPWAGAWAGALGSWGRHLFRNQIPLWPNLPLGLLGIFSGLTTAWWRPVLLFPLLEAWNLILYRLDQRRGSPRPRLLRWHAAFWDETQPLSFTGLDDHLLLVLERDPDEGQKALDYLKSSRQRWAARTVQIELEARRLEACADVTAIGRVHRDLISGELIGPAALLLRGFARISQDVEASLNQTTPYHRRLALGAVEDRLSSLARELTVSSEPYATRFYPVASHWRELLVDYLDTLQETVEQSQEIDNPYVVGIPLTTQQEIFVGRADIVARIEQILLDRRRPPLLLYGQRRTGKTSLLRNLGRLLPGAIVPLFVDGQRVALASNYPDFLYNLAGEIRKSAGQQRYLTLPPLARDDLTGSPFTCFNEWLDTIEQTLGAQGYNIALLALDEFESLDDGLDRGRYDESDLFSLLRHLIQHRPLFKVMLAGSHSLEEFERWASYLINVQVIKIGYLAEPEARQLIERPIQDFPLRYEPEASRRVLQLTRAHPALVQLLCYEIVILKNEQPAAVRRLVRQSDVELAAPRALASGAFFFADIRRNQITESSLPLLRFIAARGEGAVVSRSDLLANHPGAPAELDPTLSLLIQRDLLEKIDTGYRFQVELIRRWFQDNSL